MTDLTKDADHIRQQSNNEWISEYEGNSSGNTISPRSSVPDRSSPYISEPDDDEAEVPALIPEGNYTARIIAFETQSSMFGGGKLKLTFEIAEDGPYQGTKLNGWYNVTLKEDPKTSGKFKVAPMSKYRKEFVTVLADAARRRLDRLFPSLLMGLNLNIEVGTVRHSSDGVAHVAGLEYSKVRGIISKA